MTNKVSKKTSTNSFFKTKVKNIVKPIIKIIKFKDIGNIQNIFSEIKKGINLEIKKNEKTPPIFSEQEINAMMYHYFFISYEELVSKVLKSPSIGLKWFFNKKLLPEQEPYYLMIASLIEREELYFKLREKYYRIYYLNKQ